MQTVFVAGGAGYIGAHTCKALAQAGYQPGVYDNLTPVAYYRGDPEARLAECEGNIAHATIARQAHREATARC